MARTAERDCGLFVVQCRFDGGDDLGRVGCDGRLEAGDGFAVAIEDEFGEVPLDVAADLRIDGLVGEVLVERGLVGALDGDLGHHGEGYVVFFAAEGLDLGVGAGLLIGEVVGGDADDDEAAVLVLFVDRFEGLVLRGVAATAGYVDQEEDLAVELREAGGLAVDGFEGVVVDAGSGGG